MARALFNQRDFVYRLVTSSNLAVRVLHADGVAQAELLAAAALNELLREEPLDVVVYL